MPFNTKQCKAFAFNITSFNRLNTQRLYKIRTSRDAERVQFIWAEHHTAHNSTSRRTRTHTHTDPRARARTTTQLKPKATHTCSDNNRGEPNFDRFTTATQLRSVYIKSTFTAGSKRQ
jgi:uncharacterized protein YdaU (DUF1376 family)